MQYVGKISESISHDLDLQYSQDIEREPVNYQAYVNMQTQSIWLALDDLLNGGYLGAYGAL